MSDTVGGEPSEAEGTRRARGISSALACFCGGSFVLFHAVSFFGVSMPPESHELGALGLVIAASLGLLALAGFWCGSQCLRSYGVTRSRWVLPALLVAGVGINVLNTVMLSGPYGLWLSSLPSPVVIVLLPGLVVPIGIAAIVVYLALRART
ncbi:hypothetical protein ITJ44_08800 [Clavibacter sp. VKM Ac-2873]|uniref:hypothetical protein n=1 Tax=Clavibacter sp. VKM Ac-2873 TaxID=2783813 RepID=UPI00188C7EC0|nr:hypothetical protein [Clavibacter sp. VKM Ac-2873]MBF4618168.1 hypothetical protein [Clavibacter sp. VKM Ac-2873]